MPKESTKNGPIDPDLQWTDDEIVMSDMTPDTDFVFERMTVETIEAVDAKPGELVLDVACGRAIDALKIAEAGADLVGIEASDTMIEKALEFIGEDRSKVRMVRSLAEDLPFADETFDKVVCKGAMDHFANIEDCMAEMGRVTKQNGKVIIAIANFESLTCRLGRAISPIKEFFTGRGPGDHPFWEPPLDHNYKFDMDVLVTLMRRHCVIYDVRGISMMWGYPGWGGFMRKLPKGVSAGILKGLDKTAHVFPTLSDVLVAVGKPIKIGDDS